MSKEEITSKNEVPAKAVAAIDIGSNSIRMVMAQVFADGTFEVLEKLQQALRLGQDTFRKGRLSEQTIRAAILVLRNYQEVLRTYNVQQVWAVATSAVREVSHTDAFLDRVFVATGLDVRAISAAEENRLNISAIRETVGKKFLTRRQALVVEVGGDVRWAAKQVGKAGEILGLIGVQPKQLKSLITQYERYPADHLAKSLKIPFIEAETRPRRENDHQ